MPILHLCYLKREMLSRSPASAVIPSIGEQDAPNIHEEARDVSRRLSTLAAR